MHKKIAIGWKDGDKFEVIDTGSDSELGLSDIPKGFIVGRLKNPNKSKWITNGAIDRRIPIDDTIPNGWKLGQKSKNIGQIWINNKIVEKRISNANVLPIGWYLGRL